LISVKLNLTKDYRQAKAFLTKTLKEKVSWATDVKVDMAPKEVNAEQPENRRVAGMKDVKNIIAVSSCKGGVGKSTVAVNLAFSLMKQGLKVGLFDADLYGPSLPTMISPEHRGLHHDPHDPKLIAPIMFSGVKCMSYGFAGSSGASIMRGPMVT
jgi:Mrp family chromosome partitioning ATPase